MAPQSPVWQAVRPPSGERIGGSRSGLRVRGGIEQDSVLVALEEGGQRIVIHNWNYGSIMIPIVFSPPSRRDKCAQSDPHRRVIGPAVRSQRRAAKCGVSSIGQCDSEFASLSAGVA